MIPPIRALYLRLYDEFAAQRIDSGDPAHWEIPADEIAYMEQIQTADDLGNYTDDGTGRFHALAYDCALALGLSKWDAQSIADDH